MANSADPDQLASKPTDLDLRYLQRQGISGLSRTRVNRADFFLSYLPVPVVLYKTVAISSFGVFSFNNTLSTKFYPVIDCNKRKDLQNITMLAF